MKKNSVLFFLSFFYLLSNAQFKLIAEGPVFDESETGISKVVQMKSGYTFYCHYLNDLLNLKIYDQNHAQKFVKSIKPSYVILKLKAYSVNGIFEINGDLTMIIRVDDSKKDLLYRLIIDGKTGEVKEDKKIAEIKYGHFPVPTFFIRKDPDSDNYALIILNTLESDKNKKTEIVHYGSDHNEINRLYYSSGDNKYKYFKYIDMVVIGREKTGVLAYAYFTEDGKGKEYELVLINVDSGSKNILLEELTYSKDRMIQGGMIRYNSVTKKMILLAALKEDKKRYESETLMAFIDPFSKKLEKVIYPAPKQASEKSIELFGKKTPYVGKPQNLFINNDGSFTVLYEELFYYLGTNSGTDFRNIAISFFSLEGLELKSYLVPKSHYLFRITDLNPFYHYEREVAGLDLYNGNYLKSFAYLNGINKTYLLFNDIERNGETQLKGKVTTINGVGVSDGFYFNLSDNNGNNVLPQRQFVFGRPDDKREHNLGLFTISDYDKANNLYVTLKLEKGGRTNGVKLVWLQPQ